MRKIASFEFVLNLKIQGLYITITVILSLAVIIFTIIYNNKEKKKFERQIDDYKKPQVDD